VSLQQAVRENRPPKEAWQWPKWRAPPPPPPEIPAPGLPDLF
jgi:hypothetical protein